AEPVAGVILADRLDGVELLLRLARELHALGLQLGIGRAAVIGLEDPDPERTLLDELAQRRRALGAAHRPLLDLHQRKPQIGLRLRADRQPAEAVVHRRVIAHLKPELVPIEMERFLLVEDMDDRVRKTLDHGMSLPSWVRANAGVDCHAGVYSSKRGGGM